MATSEPSIMSLSSRRSKPLRALHARRVKSGGAEKGEPGVVHGVCGNHATPDCYRYSNSWAPRSLVRSGFSVRTHMKS